MGQGVNCKNYLHGIDIISVYAICLYLLFIIHSNCVSKYGFTILISIERWMINDCYIFLISVKCTLVKMSDY